MRIPTLLERAISVPSKLRVWLRPNTCQYQQQYRDNRDRIVIIPVHSVESSRTFDENSGGFSHDDCVARVYTLKKKIYENYRGYICFSRLSDSMSFWILNLFLFEDQGVSSGIFYHMAFSYLASFGIFLIPYPSLCRYIRFDFKAKTCDKKSR